MPFDDVLASLRPLTPEEREAAERYRQMYWHSNAPGAPGCSLDEADVAIVEGDWAQCLRQLGEQHLRPLHASELAQLRIQTGAESVCSQNGFWVAENADYLPNGEVLFADQRYNPLLKFPQEATEAHSKGHEFYLEDQIVKELEERAEEDVEKALQSGVLRVSRAKLTSPILMSAFSEDERMRFLFREHAQAYGAWLQQQNINAVHQYNPNAERKAFGRPVWVYDLDYWSYIDSSSVLFISSGLVGGVRERA